MSDKIELLKVRNLTIQFPFEGNWKTVVNNIDFSIKKGEILGLVGESGSGKTMTALFLLGLVNKKAKIEFNTFQFNDKSLTVKKLNELENFQKSLRGKSIGMIFQEPMSALNPTMTCGSQLTEAILQHFKIDKKEAEKQAKHHLKKVNLPEEYFDRYPHQLSGGQQQRIVIAIAICSKPQLLLADEPTTALDATVRKEILALLKNLSISEDLSILFISHDLPAVASIADRILVMRNGKIVERGLTDDILKNPTHEYTRGLLECIPTLDFEGDRLPVLSSSLLPLKERLSENNLNPSIGFSDIDENAAPSKVFSSGIGAESLLKIQNLSVTYQNQTWLSFAKKSETRAVIDLNFEVFEGETLGIVGESGSGKSSLGKAIINLVDSKSKSGDILYKNQNLSQLTDNQWFEFRKDIQIIFQNPLNSLNPRQPIGLGLTEVLSVFYKKNEIEKENQVIELLKSVGLSENDFYKYPHEFSGGQRQRISIARALAVEPKILICDECVSSLDVSVQADILNLLKDLQEKFGLTMLFISHDLGVIKFMSERILVMNQGKLVQLETSGELFKNPKTEYVRELIDSVPKMKK